MHIAIVYTLLVMCLGRAIGFLAPKYEYLTPRTAGGVVGVLMPEDTQCLKPLELVGYNLFVGLGQFCSSIRLEIEAAEVRLGKVRWLRLRWWYFDIFGTRDKKKVHSTTIRGMKYRN